MSKQTIVMGETLAYNLHHVQGAKETFLFLHGAFMNKDTTNEIALSVGMNFTNSNLIQLDLPSHGESTSETGPKETVDEIANVVRAAIQAMRDAGDIVGDLIVIGWSMGGSAAIQMALQGLDAKALVLLNTAPDWTIFEGFRGMDGEDTLQAFTGTFAQDIAIGLTPEQTQTWMDLLPSLVSSPATAQADVKALLAFNVHDQLADISIPVLIISSELDPVANISAQDQMNEHIPDVYELRIVAGDGHSLLMKQPDIIAETIRTTLS